MHRFDSGSKPILAIRKDRDARPSIFRALIHQHTTNSNSSTTTPSRPNFGAKSTSDHRSGSSSWSYLSIIGVPAGNYWV
ncbi:hypothetical protein HHX47_DHR7000413 [Lentinula edodes]|nr:hypothetical protein HHX47_DHR7000413 [Lentinula edodes]